MPEPIFHLSFPVASLDEARAFYIDLLGCQQGRIGDQWIDIFFWGHQITLHEIPSQVLSPKELGVRHFGIVLDWSDWELTVARLNASGHPLVAAAEVKYAGTAKQQGKILLRDPSGNLIEIKAYLDPQKALGLPV